VENRIMAREIKYTTDGKKVVVIGNLNAQEKIVQEIFIIDGQEVPSGENFVVKTLHDAPAVSWNEKRKKELEQDYKRMREEEDDIKKKYRIVCKEFENKMSYIKKVCNKLTPETFDLLTDYVTGNIKFIVLLQYSIEILSFEKFQQDYEGQLRLISFFGKDDGTFSYARGDYYDYSGGCRHFHPCRTYDDAIDIVRKYIANRDKYSDYDIKAAKEYGIELEQDKFNSYKEERVKTFRNNLAKAHEEVKKWENLLSESI